MPLHCRWSIQITQQLNIARQAKGRAGRAGPGNYQRRRLFPRADPGSFSGSFLTRHDISVINKQTYSPKEAKVPRMVQCYMTVGYEISSSRFACS